MNWLSKNNSIIKDNKYMTRYVNLTVFAIDVLMAIVD